MFLSSIDYHCLYDLLVFVEDACSPEGILTRHNHHEDDVSFLNIIKIMLVSLFLRLQQDLSTSLSKQNVRVASHTNHLVHG